MGDELSVNRGIPEEICSVKYPSFDEAVRLCLQEGKCCYVAKSDMSRAFRNVPLRKDQWYLLVMKVRHPKMCKIYYFVDKCLPFGSSISCAIFQRFSDAIAYLVKARTKKQNVNYLDDFLFASLMRKWCNEQVSAFLRICELVKFPVTLEKTVWGCTLMTFLGMLLDMENQLICIPLDKINKSLDMIDYFLNRNNKKATVLQIQQLCGFLNFLCKAVVPGRTFVRRIYAGVSSKLSPHHHVRITSENRMDLEVWKRFLSYPKIFNRPFWDCTEWNAVQLDMYSDASRNFKLGFGAYCGTEWTFGQWDEVFMTQVEPSIEYLELFAVTVGILNWLHVFKNKRIVLFCDNEAVVHMINNATSKCKNCMVLLRLVILECMIHNTKVRAKHVGTKENGKADALSRLDWKRFWSLGSNMNALPTPIPENIWPLNKIWIS